ncbi:MAG: hypothetical protein IT423_22550 [Pirellulaceae bacterium]|nr:hypothetical protein [Pirellulaceae bacterium]
MVGARRLRSARTALGLLACLWSGCASPTYNYGLPNRPDVKPALGSLNELTFGGDHPKLDKVESWVHYPITKIKQWIPRKSPTPDPEEQRRLAIYKAQEYLVLNELTDVHIDVRQYDPAAQWQRLRENDRIHPFWKYTAGTVSHLGYAWLPGRVFHYDSFNPYTNTLSINSTRPSMALYEAAEAKIIRNRKHPGTYLAACYLPVVPLVKDVRVANDVLSYARIREEWELEKQLTPQIYSAFGADLVSQATSLLPGAAYMPFYYKPLLSLAGRTAGRASGHAVVGQRDMQRQLMSSLLPSN